MISDFGFWISDLAPRHMATPSLGHYASLTFVVIGREQIEEERDFAMGAAFSRDLTI